MGALYLALSGDPASRSCASSRPCCRTSRTRSTCSASATRPRSSCARRTATWCRCSMPARSTARSTWRWTTSRGRTCARCGTAARKKGIAFPVDVAVHIVKELVPRPGLRALLRRPQAGSPRRLAAQRPALVQRRGEADRLRAGASTLKLEKTAPGHHLRQGHLHVAGAGARRAARRPHRSLRRRASSCGSCSPGGSCFPPGRSTAAVGRAATRAQPADRSALEARVARAARARRHRAQGAGHAIPATATRAARRCARDWRASWRRGAGHRLGAPGDLPPRPVRRGHRRRSATEREG